MAHLKKQHVHNENYEANGIVTINVKQLVN